MKVLDLALPPYSRARAEVIFWTHIGCAFALILVTFLMFHSDDDGDGRNPKTEPPPNSPELKVPSEWLKQHSTKA